MKQSILNPIRKLLRNKISESILYFLASKLNAQRFVSKLAPGNNLYKIDSLRFTKKNGINYALDISDYQHWIIYFGITKDDPIGLFELVQKGDTIIDIGSNIGQTAMTFAKIAGEQSMVYGFEPDPVNYSKAMENLKLNSFKNIEILNLGLGSKSEELNLKINSPLNRGGNRIDKNKTKDSFIIKVEMLDSLFENKKIKKIDLIKIDVEGFELEVLKGASSIIRNFKPKMFIEVDDTNLKEQGSSAKDLIEYLYTFDYFIVNSETKEIVKKESDFRNSHFDIICS